MNEATPRRFPRGTRIAGTAALLAGSATLAETSFIHLHLWQQAYRHIPAIGPLFLAQGLAAAALALAVLVLRRPVSALAAAAFLASSAGGLLVSTQGRLFGFHESLSAPYAGMALGSEMVGVALFITAILCAVGVSGVQAAGNRVAAAYGTAVHGRPRPRVLPSVGMPGATVALRRAALAAATGRVPGGAGLGGRPRG